MKVPNHRPVFISPPLSEESGQKVIVGWKLTFCRAFTRIAGLLKRGPFRPVVDEPGNNHETYFPTQHHQARSHPRFPCSHGYQERPYRPVASSRQGPQASGSLILRHGW